MPAIEISEIQEKYARNRRAMFIVIFLIILSISSLFASEQYKDYANYLKIIAVIFGLSILIIISVYPRLSTYESIRYYLNELTISLNSKDSKKAKNNLDELAFNLNTLNEELEDIIILKHAKKILSDFWSVLKYEIYPNLSNKDKMGVHKLYLEQMDKAISEEDINSLYSIIKSLKSQDLKTDNTIVLPYEKPPIVNEIIAKSKNYVVANFKGNIFFRFISLSIIFYIIAVNFFPLDGYLIIGICTISAALASGYKSKG